MNIKSLLLGSAAALVAVSGARAADVIVPVAAEPADYVRVCDVYGTGFYYIPGTETCLSVSGYVRFKYAVVDNAATNNDEGDDYAAGSGVRVRLNFDAREETELGTLRAFARVQATQAFGNRSGSIGGSDQNYSMDLGYIQLGGLTMGYLDTLWTEGGGLLTDTDLPVGDFQVNRVSYTYAANGFSAAVSLEDDGSRDFAPDVVARLGYDAGFGSLYIAGSYDENVELNTYRNRDFGATAFVGSDGRTRYIDNNGVLVTSRYSTRAGLLSTEVEEDAFALKGGVSLKDVVMTDSELKIEGSYAFDPTAYSTIGLFDNVRSIGNNDIGVNSNIPVEWQVGAGYAQSFGKLGLAFSGVYGETFDLYADVNGDGVRDMLGTGEYYKLVGNVGYEITNNFDMLAEVSYTDIEFDNGTQSDQTAGFIQFIRSF
ncbi:MAG TPA: porin [Aurantimonas coralicida]|uniref:Porin n=2 Tax=root TaxID=1 RepID=A0A9C9THF7_9HYPH|nr:porin [Aurantimonas coralicida]HEU00676.1 porin [Aurantimonas coralicida]